MLKFIEFACVVLEIYILSYVLSTEIDTYECQQYSPAYKPKHYRDVSFAVQGYCQVLPVL